MTSCLILALHFGNSQAGEDLSVDNGSCFGGDDLSGGDDGSGDGGQPQSREDG